ncbi:hypothetical protein [Phenylobacterium montanum]|uniref:Uncharacterized protein n=1 Tax=Phenylobacterium montanum TaxID=2823693 RepID=A0A975G363_9CAUL|nr:hypothetical protein [Caulobacter sp. S6]QUD89694.1 hypothetical protein KCG34_07435 [Caulobacter sp. S6]
MDPISAISSGLTASMSVFSQASTALGNAAAGNSDIASAITDQIGAKVAFEAEAKVMQSLAQTQKQVLDILV